MKTVTCDACGGSFQIKAGAKKPVKCKLCHSLCDVPKLPGREKSAADKGRKCPACGKSLGAGVKFCVACGTSTIDPAAAHLAGWAADRELEKRRFFHRMTMWLFGWWR
ncbi:MAG: zinc-ribbon domain-containing protein [Planctomycetaceae bacterium]